MKTMLLLLSAGVAVGEITEPPAHDDSNLTFYLDNDGFARKDNGYTNGFRLSWISGIRPVEELPGVHRWMRYLIGDESSLTPFQRFSGFKDSSDISYSHGFALTQLMFTPDDREPSTPPPGERPYAGVLLLGFSLHAMDENVLNTVALSVGMVGPHAYAEEMQDLSTRPSEWTSSTAGTARCPMNS